MELVITIGIKISAGVVMRERNVRPGVCAIKKWLTPGALSGVVVVAIDCFAEGFRDINPFASRIHLADVATIA
jgi:hypothetical protein